MAFRFFRRFRIAPGLSINLSKSGASLSAGPRGAKVTAGTRGLRRSVGVPGTGMYWYDQSGASKSKSQSSKSRQGSASTGAGPRVRAQDRLSLGFFQRLFIDAGEEALVDGMRAYFNQDENKAYHSLRQASDKADGAFLAGILAINKEQWDQAANYFRTARQKHHALGKYFQKYGISISVNLHITEYITAVISPDVRGIRLALAEVYQALARPHEALKVLKQIHDRDPEDVVIRLSLAELLVEDGGDKRSCKQVVRLARDVENESAVHAALLLYKGRALRRLGLPTAARDVLTTAFRRKKNRPEDLLRQVQYDRALVYEQLGKKSRAHSELEKIYAQAPDYEDVAQRLDLK